MRKYQYLNMGYEKHSSMDGDECYYCGHFADTIDHCPPLCLYKHYKLYPKILVKACETCNFSLGAKPLPTLLSRVEYLCKRYRKKYQKYLKMPDWCDEEIGHLTGSLRIYVENERIKVETSRDRIEFLMDRLNELTSTL